MDNNEYEMTPKRFLKTIAIIHLALLLGLCAFGGVIFSTESDWAIHFSVKGDSLLFVVPVFAISCIFLGDFLYQKQLNALSGKTRLREKLAGFQTASLIKYALIEGPALFALISAMNTNNVFYLAIAALLTLYLFFQKPTNDKIENDLSLGGDLKSQFRKSDQKIA